jgi:DNA-binding MarR family transcriptional regulator
MTREQRTQGAGAEKERQIQIILDLADKLHWEIRRVTKGTRGAWLNIDLTLPQAKSLVMLFTDGALRPSDLASALGVSLPTVTGIIDRLEEKGLVVREDDPNDRRVVLCKLSAQGRQVMDAIWQFSLRQVRALLEAMTLAELKQVEGGVQAFLRSFSTVHPESAHDSSDQQ